LTTTFAGGRSHGYGGGGGSSAVATAEAVGSSDAFGTLTSLVCRVRELGGGSLTVSAASRGPPNRGYLDDHAAGALGAEPWRLKGSAQAVTLGMIALTGGLAAADAKGHECHIRVVW